MIDIYFFLHSFRPGSIIAATDGERSWEKVSLDLPFPDTALRYQVPRCFQPLTRDISMATLALVALLSSKPTGFHPRRTLRECHRHQHQPGSPGLLHLSRFHGNKFIRGSRQQQCARFLSKTQSLITSPAQPVCTQVDTLFRSAIPFPTRLKSAKHLHQKPSPSPTIFLFCTLLQRTFHTFLATWTKKRAGSVRWLPRLNH